MPRRAQRMGSDAAIPLRKGNGANQVTDQQKLILGAFLVAAMVEGLGIYCTVYQNSGSYAVKLYRDREQYADSLMPADDWLDLLGDYAKQLGFERGFQELLAAKWASDAPSGPQRAAKG
jgi:hypothetical protein